ncbi:hypothetical protein KSP40_PGU021339 [Platanthera guangdongensis]|uniref:Uncharacterized protein n=1 Tax=Platanthera guangdongensis TaxID=2320717 RepID=A0ABR2N5V3_9ASPA
MDASFPSCMGRHLRLISRVGNFSLFFGRQPFSVSSKGRLLLLPSSKACNNSPFQQPSSLLVLADIWLEERYFFTPHTASPAPSPLRLEPDPCRALPKPPHFLDSQTSSSFSMSTGFLKAPFRPARCFTATSFLALLHSVILPQNFSTNPYFEGTKLSKFYTFFDDGTTNIAGTSIKWKEGMVIKTKVIASSLETNQNKRETLFEKFSTWRF